MEPRLHQEEVTGRTLIKNLTGEDKGSGPQGVLHGFSVLAKLPGEGALLDLDNCLRRSLDTFRQTPLPIKHSAARSFTPQQLLSESRKKEQICF